ncbi:hypothetical protein CEUSTIGMA_g5960.t1 [Chlamydomonas eustigma]|uniref:Poly [ADP-ribose] polymerase n=1 Tax=Chlamydomonas eustigma TaxID=1157962 RepID=A0A250X6Z1_9CHLO|nr:hypothetical protein CEUSTIGMA_g5960.t1 [Chlamydomonas eustigma]|eukprot:GAX78520.1 hypothetical protein CEUSTIGMA_g5960.t1 [Chlamydomonas eustigma]
MTEKSVPFHNSLLAFHGTSFERLHSILNTGLQPASGTRLQRNGAVHGQGIYMSTDYGVAFSFCNPASAWKESMLGCKLRAVLVCEVESDQATSVAPDGPEAEHSRSTNNATPLPQHYLLVQRPNAIHISHVLVYCDEKNTTASALGAGDSSTARSSTRQQGTGSMQRLDLAKTLILAYAAWMLLQYAFQNRQFRRWLGLR